VHLLLLPARHLFLYGPTLLGCWHGLPLPDVCAGMTGVSADFWRASNDKLKECETTVDAHVWGYLVPLYVGAYFWALYVWGRFSILLLIKKLFYFFKLNSQSHKGVLHA